MAALWPWAKAKTVFCLLIPPGKGVEENMTAIVRDYHRKYPLRLGIPKAEISSKVKLGSHFLEGLQKLIAAGLIVEENSLVGLQSHEIKLTKDQQNRMDAYLKQLNQNPYSPAPDITLEPDLLNLLIDRSLAVKTLAGVIFSAQAFNDMTSQIMAKIKHNGKITLAETRDMFQSSRKYVLAILEHMDDRKLTRRVGDDRVVGEKG
jgi:selenocysteine-specific elongation factor